MAGRAWAALADDAAWYAKKASRGCGWVAKKTDRCAKTAKVRARDACALACRGTGADSATWTSKGRRDCAWVAKNASKRCKKKDKTAAGDACPNACGACSRNG